MTTDEITIERLGVDLGERSYDILIGAGLLADAGRLIAPVLRAPRVAVVTDRNVADAGHLKTLETALAAAGIAFRTIILEPGEQTKDFAHLERVIGDLLAAGIDRKTTLIALGGGVIGDLTGVCAALTLRGIDFVQVPTTLLAQVDSSVGGKTAINTAQGKNLVGAFYQPRLVLADTGVLDTLPPRELQAGYAEVVKYGVIDMPGFFDWLEGNGPAVLAGDAAARRRAILTCCDAKARIVSADETEQGQRALLNLGHTFGHALEAETGYGGGLLHGEAVAIGMVMALTLSTRLGHCKGNDAARLRAHLEATGLPADLARLNTGGWTADRLLAHMMKDKKTEDGRLTFILARAIGDAFIEHAVPTVPVADVLNEFLSARG
jgi:3-dehydroquinate synthase